MAKPLLHLDMQQEQQDHESCCVEIMLLVQPCAMRAATINGPLIHASDLKIPLLLRHIRADRDNGIIVAIVTIVDDDWGVPLLLGRIRASQLPHGL